MVLLRDQSFRIPNLKEICFLAQFSHPQITKFKQVEIPSYSPGQFELKIKLYEEYSGLKLFHTEEDSQKIIHMNMKENLTKSRGKIDRLINKITVDINPCEELMDSIITNFNQFKSELKIYIQDTQVNIRQKVKDNITYILYQILSIFEQTEILNIIHGDIKSHNFLVDQDLKVTVIDWGFVYLCSKDGINCPNNMIDSLAPENLNNVFYGPISDIYNLGVLFQELSKDMFLDPDLKFIISSMVERDHKKRPPASALIKNFIFDQYRKLIIPIEIKPLLEIDPNYIRNHPDLRSDMREILIDWIYDVSNENIDEPALSFVLASTLVDTYLSNVTASVPKNSLQLLGISCIYLAQIFLCDKFMSEAVLVDYTANAYTINQLIEQILKVLEVLKYRVYQKTFDREIQNPEYRIIRLILMDRNHIGKSNKELISMYEKIKKNVLNYDEYISIERPELDKIK